MTGPRKPARTPEAREQEMTALAMDFAERQLRDGTAPAPLVMMFAKPGFQQTRLQNERLIRENKLLEAKVEQMESATQSNEKLDAVLRALQKYSGQAEDVSPDLF